jgi:hypothetical protein
MSTRCNIAIYDNYNQKDPGARLYHHCDGYPSFMVKKLTDFLDYIAKIDNYKFNFDSESVAAMMIVLSIEDYEVPLLPFSTDRLDAYDLMRPEMKYRANNGLPVFEPCIKNHGDIAYTYKVNLNNSSRTFTIDSRKV